MQKDPGVRIITLCLIGNIFLLLIKGGVGLWADSEALKADAINSAGDVISALVVTLGLKYSLKPRDKGHHYGHGKAEALVSFLVGAMVIVGAGFLVYEAVGTIIAKSTQQPSLYALLAALVSIGVKLFMFKATYSAGKRLNSIAVMTNAMDHRNDIFATSGAAVAIGLSFVGQFAGVALLTIYAEPVIAIVISGLIVKTAWNIIKESANMLLDAAPDDETIRALSSLASSVQGVKELSWLKCRRMGRGLLVDAAVEVCGSISVADGHDIADAVHDAIAARHPEVIDVVVHVNPDNTF